VSGPILLFGARGQVGHELSGLARARGVALTALGRDEADICDADAVNARVAATRPSLIVNAAAYTAVDKAESERDAAERGNVWGPRVLARAAHSAGVPLVHISTDYVFDGTKPGPYVESDPIAPIGAYGATKAAGETAVREAAPAHVILRTAWVYGAHGANFLKTMLRLAAERDEVRVVADQRGCPTATLDIAEAILAVHASIAAGKTPWGTYHFAGTGATTWHGFAEEIVARQAEFTGKRPPVRAIATSDYPTPAKRPANSELDSSLFANTFGYRAAPWQDRTRDVVAALFAR
jgi:dTDP-4-dehydrorhamnose reductase